MPPGGIRNRNPSKRAAAESRLTPRGQRDRIIVQMLNYNKMAVMVLSHVWGQRDRIIVQMLNYNKMAVMVLSHV
jgi:hypothetical protein